MTRARCLGVVLLLFVLASPVAEAWDSWDQALPSGNDTEISTLLVTLTVGLALVLATSLRTWLSACLSARSWRDGLTRPRSTQPTAAGPGPILPFARIALRI